MVECNTKLRLFHRKRIKMHQYLVLDMLIRKESEERKLIIQNKIFSIILRKIAQYNIMKGIVENTQIIIYAPILNRDLLQL